MNAKHAKLTVSLVDVHDGTTLFSYAAEALGAYVIEQSAGYCAILVLERDGRTFPALHLDVLRSLLRDAAK